MQYGQADIPREVSIGSGKGLFPDGTKPLHEPELTYHQKSFMGFIPGVAFEIYKFEIIATSPREKCWILSPTWIKYTQLFTACSPFY